MDQTTSLEGTTPDAAVHTVTTDSTDAASENRPKVLVVDDLLENLRLLANLLIEDGYEVKRSPDGAMALSNVPRFNPDVILLDIMMPEMSGYDVTRKVRQNPRLSHIPILLFTAQDDIDQRSALEAGADGFIRKPFDIDHLVDKIEDVLQKKAAA